MKKATIIIIAIIYVSSIVLISFFGMEVSVLNPVIPVEQVLCINQTDNNAVVEDKDDYKLIKLRFTTPGDPVTLTGTMLLLQWQVLPDNADTKDVKFVYSDSERVTFVTDDTGRELGQILFAGTTILDVKIMSTDGTKQFANVKIVVY